MTRIFRWLPTLFLLCMGLSLCAQQATPLPSVTVDFGKTPSGPALSSSLQAMLLLTVLSLAPTILMTATSFTRIIVVMHFLRQGLGTQQTPSNQVLISLSLVLTFFIMAPTAREINTTVLQPLQRNELTTEQALDRTAAPMKVFMLRYTRKKDLALFLRIAKAQAPKTKADVPMECLLPAFLISELKTAFEIGFMIFLPFLVVDIVVASILLSMGMMMLPPVVISLPFKVLLFVLADGWYLIIGSLVKGYTG
ncbi:MAG TPA: flagellar type III secretion system pore protein FliP [Geothrix sp.]|nr:flagellar type III secretion system pore protein FliP [Geothrix sp.]